MQKLIYLFPLLLLFISVKTGKAQDFDNPAAYLSYMNDQHRQIMKDFLSYTSAVAHGKSAKKVDNRRIALLQSVKDARKKISSMPPYKGDKSLRDSTSAFFDITYHVLNDDYAKIVDMEEISEQSYDAMEAYLLAKKLADEKLDEANARLEEALDKFAAGHNVNLIQNEDKLSKKAAQAARVNNYYNDLYLIFFKSYKQEAYLLEAIQSRNINGIEQNKTSLARYAGEGLSMLSSVKTFDGDNSLITACREMLTFYKKEADAKVPLVTDFYLKEENFDKVKTAFEAKKENERTQEDVDAYNKAVNEMNTAVSKYNDAINQLNAERNNLLNKWNKSVSNFLEKHVPKYR